MEQERDTIRNITRAAQQDASIRVLIMTGDRVNKAAVQQPLARYEFALAAEDPLQALHSKVWEQLGDAKLLRRSMREKQVQAGIEVYAAWLLYDDMARVCMKAVRTEEAVDFVSADTLSQIMLDKDGLLPPMGMPTDLSRRTKAPSEERFNELFDGFFEAALETGIALRKEQLIRGLKFLSEARTYLLPATEFAIATEYDYLINLGDRGRNFKAYLEKDEYEAYLKCFPTADVEYVWTALFNACSLFRGAGMKICEKEGFAYPKRVDVAILHHLRSLWGEQHEQNV